MSQVKLEHLYKRFGNVTAVGDFNLDVKDGEFISFLGPSGCGKTTTLRMIAGFERPTEGSIILGILLFPVQVKDFLWHRKNGI